jgi:hypothetical protein
MSDGEIFILCIVLAGISAGIVKRYLHLKATRPVEDPGYRQRMDALEQRIRTLESIVTDKGYDLKREFDRL